VAYRFAGFFACPTVPRPNVLPTGAVWQNIVTPFDGVGVRLPAFIGKVPPAAEVEALARQFGLYATERWLYLTYDCWAGYIDFVYGLGSRSGEPFGPVDSREVFA
jgi:hypothetical protein